MGSLLLSPIYLPGRPEDAEPLREKMLHVMSHLTDEELVELNQDMCEFFEVSSPSYNVIGDRTDLSIMVDAFFDALMSSMVSYIAMDDCTAWIAGGISYGDDPSEEYTMFEQIRVILSWMEGKQLLFADDHVCQTSGCSA